MTGDLLRIEEKKFSKIIQAHAFKDIKLNICKGLILFYYHLVKGFPILIIYNSDFKFWYFIISV